jgi:uncharacterized membrane protein
LRSLRRRAETLAAKAEPRRTAANGSRPPATNGARPNILPKFAIGQAVAKTITFRIIVTSLDFSVNYVVIGELATAAGLSTFNMIAGPLFYLGHEAVWNYLGPPDRPIDIITQTGRPAAGEAAHGGWRSLKISRALAKTSRSAPSPRSWISPPTMWSFATSRRPWSCPLPASFSGRSPITGMRRPGTILRRSKPHRRHRCCCPHLVDLAEIFSPCRETC